MIKKLIDPGYFSINFKTGKIGVKDFNDVFQITIQDISKLEERQLIRQKFFSNIEIISDFDLYFNSNNNDFFDDILTFDKDDKESYFTVGDLSTKKQFQPNGALKLLTLNEEKNTLDFTKNLELLTRYWDMEFTSYADIGCCTTSTLGETILKIVNKSNSGDKIDYMEKKKMLFCKCAFNY